jgi:hypothetical protein
MRLAIVPSRNPMAKKGILIMNRDSIIRRAIGALGTAQAALYQLQAVPTWRRHDGTIIPITDMSYDHVTNALACLARNGAEHSQNARAYPFLLAHRERLHAKGFRGRVTPPTRTTVNQWKWKGPAPRRVSYSCFMQMVKGAVSELGSLCADPYEKQRAAKAIVTRLVQDFGVGVETERPAYGIDDHER